MKLKVAILSLLASVWGFAQTTVQFSKSHQFFDASENILKVKILVHNIDVYRSDKPIIIQLFSDLEVEDTRLPGIISGRELDKVIWPKQYTNGEEIHIPLNIKALEGIENFGLYIRKKGDNEHFTILQDSHLVILKNNMAEKSYIGISAVSGDKIKTNYANTGTIEIPFRIETKGHVPAEKDRVIVSINIKGIEQSDRINTFIVTGATSEHKILVERQKNPGIYEKVVAAINAGQQLELEISGISHQSIHQIATDSAKKSVRFNLKKASNVDASYSFHLGTNFEFATSFEARDIYYEVDVSLYNLFKNSWGLRAGMYRNTISRYLEDFMLKPTHYELVDETSEGRVYDLIQTGMAPGIHIESLGFYFNVPYKVIESDRFRAFVSPHLELIERREKYRYEVIYEAVLTTMITPYVLNFSTLPTLPNEVNSKYWEAYLGLGFPMFYHNPGRNFEVAITPILGIGYPGSYAVFTPFYTGIQDYDYIRIVEPDFGLLLFSALQFNITINPIEGLGIKLGSDFRKYFDDDREPIVSINLSTKLDFSQIFNLTSE